MNEGSMFVVLRDKITADKRRAVVSTVIGIAIIIIVAVLVRGGGDTKELRRAAQALADANTFALAADLELRLPVQLRTRERPIVGVTAEVKGDVDNSGERPQFAGTVRTEARGRGMVLFADGELRVLPDYVSFYLDDLPALLNPRGTLIEKWTRVEVPLLKTNNKDNVRGAITGILTSMKFAGEEDLPEAEDISARRYSREFTHEEEDVLQEIFRQAESGNRALHIITRLLRSFDVRSFNVWVADNEIRRIEATFDKEGDEEPRATLVISLGDYGKVVTIEEPPKELTVQSDVFSRIFGKGEIEEIDSGL